MLLSIGAIFVILVVGGYLLMAGLIFLMDILGRQLGKQKDG
jgi:hypothetical protein